MTEPVLHIPMTLSQAAKQIKGFDVIAIEEKFGLPMERLSAMKLTMSVVWAHRRRMGAEKKAPQLSWMDVENMTLQELEDFFEPEPDEPEDEGFDEGGSGKAGPV